MATNKKKRMAGDAMASNPGMDDVGSTEDYNLPEIDADTAEVTEPKRGPSGSGYQKGQKYYSEGELVEMGAPNKDYPTDDNNPYTNVSIEDFDLAAGGAGAGKGTKRLSAQDIRRLKDQGGYSKQEILDYADNFDFGDGPGASGGKAQALLDKYRASLTGEAPAEDPTPAPEVETTPDPVETPEEPVYREPSEVNVDFGDGGVNTPGVRPPSDQPVFGTPGLAGSQFVMQDNDQQSSVVGDDNSITQNQDNSVNQWSPGTGDWKDSWMKSYFS